MEKEAKQEQLIDISNDSLYTNPLDTPLAEDISILFFFQYVTANSSDSPLSAHLDEVLSSKEKDELWKSILRIAGASEEDFLFNSILRNKIEDIRRMKLSDTTIVCDRIKGFMHLKNPPKDGKKAEHRIDALFKRIRDAFAHGRVSYNDEFFILEDKKNELTARIVTTLEVLKQWKDHITTVIESKSSTTNSR